jgi:hypothetical protein
MKKGTKTGTIKNTQDLFPRLSKVRGILMKDEKEEDEREKAEIRK